MARWLISLISIALLLFFSCEKPTKQENAQTPIVQKDTLKQAQENTELLSGKQLLDSLLKKAKYKNLKKIELPQDYIYFDTLQKHKISEQELATLNLEDFHYDVYTSKLYVYGYLGKFENNHLFAILTQEAMGNKAELWLVDSLGKCKAIQKNIVHNWGDMGFVWNSYTEKINDSSFITHSKQFYYPPEQLTQKETLLISKTHFIIQKDNFFIKKTDTLLYQKPKIPR
ncbi:MAG: hypothetical protein MUC49_00965 [Raineya sp.]|jgi:hypothetical protein|nr:hypothetical protein [Raineya sp.]